MVKPSQDYSTKRHAAPRVLIHKDFHCRNLMYLNNQTLGVIDYQDAIVGPITYVRVVTQ